jgi:hypothetical protein
VEKQDFGLSKLLSSATPGKCCVYLSTDHYTFLLLPRPLTVAAWWWGGGRRWLRHCATSRKAAGSIPYGFIRILH